jgi:hypothetical protein
VLYISKNSDTKKDVVKILQKNSIDYVDNSGIKTNFIADAVAPNVTQVKIRDAHNEISNKINAHFNKIHNKNNLWSFTIFNAMQKIAILLKSLQDNVIFKELSMWNMPEFTDNNETLLNVNKNFKQISILKNSELKAIDKYNLKTILDELNNYFDKKYYLNNTSIWDNAKIYDKDLANKIKKAISLLNGLKEDVENAKNIFNNFGLNVPNTLNELKEILKIAKLTRKSLDKFIPQIFENDIESFINTVNKNHKMKWFKRHNNKKIIKDFYLPGISKKDIEADLIAVQNLKKIWLEHSSMGTLPSKMPKINTDLIEKTYVIFDKLSDVLDDFDYFNIPLEKLYKIIDSLNKDSVDYKKNNAIKNIVQLGIKRYFNEAKKIKKFNFENSKDILLKNFELDFYRGAINLSFLIDQDLNPDVKNLIISYKELDYANALIKSILISNSIKESKNATFILGLQTAINTKLKFDTVILEDFNNIPEFLLASKNSGQVILINSKIDGIDLEKYKIKEFEYKLNKNDYPQLYSVKQTKLIYDNNEFINHPSLREKLTLIPKALDINTAVFSSEIYKHQTT